MQTKKARQMSKRGFAAMNPERRKEIARKGGASVPSEKRSFSVNKELAQRAGIKGGISVPNEKRSFSINRELAKSAGIKGGKASRKARAWTKTTVEQRSD